MEEAETMEEPAEGRAVRCHILDVATATSATIVKAAPRPIS